MRLHGVVVLDGRGVGLVDDDGGLGEGRLGIAAAMLAPPRLGGRASLSRRVEVELGGLLLVGDAEKLCGLRGFGQRAGDDDGDGLAVVEDVGVLEDVDVCRG